MTKFVQGKPNLSQVMLTKQMSPCAKTIFPIFATLTYIVKAVVKNAYNVKCRKLLYCLKGSAIKRERLPKGFTDGKEARIKGSS